MSAAAPLPENLVGNLPTDELLDYLVSMDPDNPCLRRLREQVSEALEQGTIDSERLAYVEDELHHIRLVASGLIDRLGHCPMRFTDDTERTIQQLRSCL